MDSNKSDDAMALWEDVLDLLSAQNLPAATLAMLKSCTPLNLDDEALYVATASRFVQRTVIKFTEQIEACMQQVAFMPLKFVANIDQEGEKKPVATNSELSQEEVDTWNSATQRTVIGQSGVYSGAGVAAGAASLGMWTPGASKVDGTADTGLTGAGAAHGMHDGATRAGVDVTSRGFSPRDAPAQNAARINNPLVEDITETDSKLTFDRFVEAPQNKFALDAAKQVANGQNMNYNPLFIYGKSGLGKTHLLRAVQNYIAVNDPSRVCVYRVATDFIDDYSRAMKNARAGAAEALAENYHNVDVLIIDDIQGMSTAAGTIGFFFDTFNYLMGHGKQIVMAADRTPSELGLGGSSRFDERVTSRLDSGFTIGIQVPDYELKLELIDTFYERMRDDAQREGVPGLNAELMPETRKLMAERAGTNIRVIEGFVQSCLMLAYQQQAQGADLTREDVVRIANQKWPSGQKIVTVEQIQKAVEKDFDISHLDLVGSKRNKELMEPRHIAIWLTRELTDNTLADIGKKFGGRSHATIKHSIGVIDETSKTDRLLADRIARIKEMISE
ncbi:MAG: chromosomal replication initiator protein DnaA [Atopobiaceae bacterium]|jgi:chromosomal replication initiator protein